MCARGKVLVHVFVANGPVLYSHKFELAKFFRGLFVISTADVAVGERGKISDACPSINRKIGGSVFVISRRDFLSKNEKFRTCAFYQNVGSCDVHVGNHAVLSDGVLKNMHFAPFYWGVDNVIPHLLSKRSRLFNLCPIVDVVHLHGGRKDPTRDNSRIRINHPDNSVVRISTATPNVCDRKLLSRLLRNKLFEPEEMQHSEMRI